MTKREALRRMELEFKFRLTLTFALANGHGRAFECEVLDPVLYPRLAEAH